MENKYKTHSLSNAEINAYLNIPCNIDLGLSNSFWTFDKDNTVIGVRLNVTKNYISILDLNDNEITKAYFLDSRPCDDSSHFVLYYDANIVVVSCTSSQHESTFNCFYNQRSPFNFMTGSFDSYMKKVYADYYHNKASDIISRLTIDYFVAVFLCVSFFVLSMFLWKKIFPQTNTENNIDVILVTFFSLLITILAIGLVNYYSVKKRLKKYIQDFSIDDNTLLSFLKKETSYWSLLMRFIKSV